MGVLPKVYHGLLDPAEGKVRKKISDRNSETPEQGEGPNGSISDTSPNTENRCIGKSVDDKQMEDIRAKTDLP